MRLTKHQAKQHCRPGLFLAEKVDGLRLGLADAPPEDAVAGKPFELLAVEYSPDILAGIGLNLRPDESVGDVMLGHKIGVPVMTNDADQAGKVPDVTATGSIYSLALGSTGRGNIPGLSRGAPIPWY
jgi:hypothetical protein